MKVVSEEVPHILKNIRITLVLPKGRGEGGIMHDGRISMVQFLFRK